ncbi:SDR family oxidoreductase [Mycobacterium sp.]|uniref:SDR family NAD(P)-dependent oxidoreductase n=1 Tax=Mycobacterium sp. TaxID=1785 RepID=UPI002B6DEFFB|nr:SDR family oxidoreductase [Mycobacterium sp.]HTQ18125.1 SDR family oxidoreductase [Mycobacterium sp.]
MEYQGTTALITGASSGLGAALTQRFAERGANLILVARRKSELEEFAQTLSLPVGINVALYEQDLSIAGASADLAARVAADGLTVDTLINNAGVGTHGDFATQDPAALSAEVQVDVTTVVELTRAMLPQMLDSGRGALVNIASTSAYQPTPAMAVYGAAKAFVLSFTEAVAYETRRSSLKVLALSPGPMRTPFFDKLGTTRPGVGRWQTPEQVADFALHTLDRRCAPPSVISGALNAVPINAARFAPRRIVLALTGLTVGA